MRVQQRLVGLSDVRGGFVATRDGIVLEELGPSGGALSAEVAEWVGHLAEAGAAARLGALTQVVAKGGATSTVTAVHAAAIAHVRVDPAQPTAKVERALSDFAPDAPGPPPAPGPAGAPPGPFPGPASEGERPDPWAGLRHALVRGEFAEAAALRGTLAAFPGDGRPGSEALPADVRDRVTSRLLEGVGSVLAGDAVGGARILVELSSGTQPNLSVRWLALLWITRAALRSGSLAAARARVAEVIDVSKQLDVEARAVSQWIAAEVLLGHGEHERALSWVAESRARFVRAKDAWGVGHTWLTEARVLAAASREADAVAAARKACEADPELDEAQVFLACQSVLHGELDAALDGLGAVRTAAADEVRAVVDAVRGGTVSQEDAAEYLRERDAPPSARSLGVLERIAGAWPRFALARDALAWTLLKLGKYDAAGTVFRGLLEQPLTAHERASVLLGLSCIANAAQPAARAGARPPDPSAAPAPARGGAAAPATTAVFSGQLSVFALPDLLEFLRGARRSGLLVCSSPAGMGALRFRDGGVTDGGSPGAEAVGAYLVRTGRLTQAGLDAAAARSARPGEPVPAEALVGLEGVDAAAVKEALRAQITSTIRTLASWTEGEFAFNREGAEARAPDALAVSVDPQAVLLELFREQDEAGRDGGAAAAGR
ncbi:MAG: DUF4388 domain-containing protein [Anaeromyxobacter sp.]